MSQSEIVFEVSESPEGGYEARALGEAIFTEADTMDELKAMVQDAVRCHFDEAEHPRMIRLIGAPEFAGGGLVIGTD